MARILIAGCGYVGEAAADLFHQEGWEVEGWTGSAESARRLAEKPYGVRAVDIADAAAVSERCASREFDVVVQCVSSRGGEAEQYRRIYLDGARNLSRGCPRARLLFTSSTSVYAQTDGERVDESSPAEPGHEKGKILRETEELVLAHGGVVVRLGGIHGPGRSFFLTRFLEGTGAIDPDDRRLINQAHRDDIAAALLLLAKRRESGIFNVVGDEPITTREAYEWLSETLKRPLPQAAKLPERRKRGAGNKRVSNEKLRALGWEPRYPNFRVAMATSILASFGF
jgi:nucleoside-diphosphate-sugar epimerase